MRGMNTVHVFACVRPRQGQTLSSPASVLANRFGKCAFLSMKAVSKSFSDQKNMGER